MGSMSEPRLFGERTSPDLRWLVSVLWEGIPGVSVDTDPDPSDALERYVVVPSASRPRMLLPNEPALAAAGLRSFNALRRPSARTGRSAISALVRTGAASFAFRDRLTVRGAGGTEIPSRTFARALGVDIVALAVNVRRPSPFRKPVAQLLSSEGRPVGFAKIGWNEVTRRGLGREAEALGALSEGRRRILAPTLRHRGPWRAHEVLITDPLPSDVRRFGAGPPPADVTRDVAELRPPVAATLANSDAWAAVRARAEAAAEVSGRLGLSRVLPVFLDGVERRHGKTELRFGFWHGDWSPWNLGHAGDRVVAWDWEYAGAGVPVGMDLPHFHFQVAFVGERRRPSEGFDRARVRSAAALRELGLSPGAIEATCALHVAELTLRYVDAVALGASANLRFLRDAPGVLESGAAELE
jgi:hypothetical protein